MKMKRSLLLFLCASVYPVCMSAQSPKLPPAPDPKNVSAPDPATNPQPIHYDTSGVPRPLPPGREQALASTLKIIDPKIPGIRILSHRDPEFSEVPETKKFIKDPENWLLVKNGTDKTVVGLSVFYGYADNSGLHYVMDGLTQPWTGIPPGGTMPSSTGHFGAIAGYDPQKGDTKITSFAIDWVLFDDGTFYGSQKDAERIAAKSQAGRDFFGALPETVADRAVYAAALEEKTNTMEYVRSMGRLYRDAMSKELRSYRGIAVKPNGVERLLKLLSTTYRTYPAIRRIIDTEQKPLKPLSEEDGWVVTKFNGTCYRGGAPQYQVVGQTGSCDYDTYTTPYGSSGVLGVPAGEPATTLGFAASFAATCQNPNIPGKEFIGSYVGQGHNLIPGTLNLIPRHYAKSTIGTNAIPGGTPADTLYFGMAYGYSEPYGVNANVGDPGSTTLCWLVYAPPFGPYANNTLAGLPVSSGASTLVNPPLVQSNTTNTWAANNYGFMTYNFEQAYSCASPAKPNIDPLERTGNVPGPWLNMPIIYNETSVNIACLHWPDQASIDGGEIAGSTAYASYCACLSTGNSFSQCQVFLGGGSYVPACLGGDDDSGGPWWIYGDGLGDGSLLPDGQINARPSSTVSSLGSTAAPSQIGVFRGSSNSFLLDDLGLNQYVDGENEFITSFTPPGGSRFGDIGVSGDWTGDGSTKLGIFRPSTGSWWLDANNDGVFDTGDYQYQFGGLLDSNGLPEDVPVVGDWNGVGKSCIGVYRMGLWVIDHNCNGVFDGAGADTVFGFGGSPGDIPVVGNWIPWAYGQTPLAQVAIVRCYRPYAPPNDYCAGYPYYWVLDNAFAIDNNQNDHVVSQAFAYGGVGPNPAHCTSTFNCSLYVIFGGGGYQWAGGDQYVTGDWLGTGVSYPGIFRQGLWIEDQTGHHTYDTTYPFGGLPYDMGIVGKSW